MATLIIEAPVEAPAKLPVEAPAKPVEAQRYPTFEYDDWELDDTWSCDRYMPIE